MNVESFLQLSPPLLLAAALNFVGLAIKRSPLPGWITPWVLPFTGACVYPMISEISKVSFQVQNPTAFNVVIGFCIGGFAVCAHQAFTQTKERVQEGPEPKI